MKICEKCAATRGEKTGVCPCGGRFRDIDKSIYNTVIRRVARRLKVLGDFGVGDLRAAASTLDDPCKGLGRGDLLQLLLFRDFLEPEYETEEERRKREEHECCGS